MTNYQALAAIGWGPFFQQQLSLDEWDEVIPARVVEQHKSLVGLITETGYHPLHLTPNTPPLVVGDWLLLNREYGFYRLLERQSCFRRKSAGTAVNWQFIAANVDAAFIVCSLNDDFNLSRIERYLSLASAANVEPVIVLTKSDLVDDPQRWLDQVREMDSRLPVVAINALSQACSEALSEWLATGKTIVILGSSGVGKSTITNTLLGEQRQATAAIREDDDKGRHTTTNRSLTLIPGGGMILDTPGMREIQVADCRDGIAAAFSDITELASQCRFSDCSHTTEPGCAVLDAISKGALEARRLKNFQKLLTEEAINSASLSEKRAKDKARGKFYKRTLVDAHKLKGRQ